MGTTLSTALTGSDLLQLLQGMSEEELALPVHFRHSAGDYWRNTLASCVNDVEPAKVAYSEYHSNFKVMNEDDLEKLERDEDGVEVYDCTERVQDVLLIG